MIIIWGRKIRRRFHGRRPGFCPICREIRPFRVTEIRSYPHLYYITVGTGTTEAYQRNCEDCRQALDVDNEDITDAIRDRNADLETLIERTNPRIAENLAGRIEIERRVASRQITAEERQALIAELFLILAPEVEGRKAQTRLDGVSGMLLVGTAASIIAWIWFAQTPAASGLGADNATKIGIGIGVALGIVTLVSLFGDVRRYARRVVLPKLVRALRPLEPKPEEIEDTLAGCRAHNLAIGTALKSGEITDALL